MSEFFFEYGLFAAKFITVIFILLLAIVVIGMVLSSRGSDSESIEIEKINDKFDTLKEAMEEACRILSSDINKVISLEEVAVTLHMSYENFRKQFRKFTGTSPCKYRIEQKMKNAKLMLLSGISIKETALLTGYGDAYSFTKQFTHSVGISPGRFKLSVNGAL